MLRLIARHADIYPNLRVRHPDRAKVADSLLKLDDDVLSTASDDFVHGARQDVQESLLSPWLFTRNMFAFDPATHQRLKRVIAPAFTARRMRVVEPRVRQLISELLDDLDSLDGNRPVDLVEQYTLPLAVRTIAVLFGIPDEVHPSLKEDVAVMFSTQHTLAVIQAAHARVKALLEDLLNQRRAQRRDDDLTSWMISAYENESPTPTGEERAEQREMLFMLVAAGFLTTAGWHANCVGDLLMRPSRLDDLRRQNDPTAWKRACDAILADKPTLRLRLMRYPRQDVTVPGTGTTIPKGDGIVMNYHAINHDLERFGSDIDLLDVTRDVKHYSFGLGVRRCIGAQVAKMQVHNAVPELFGRFPCIELEDATRLHQPESFIHAGYPQLPALLRVNIAIDRGAGAPPSRLSR